jgi:hypothetical protein
LSSKESSLREGVRRLLKQAGAFVAAIHGSGYMRPGLPDFVACLGGRFIAIELKAPGRYRDPRQGLSDAQKVVLAELEAAGALTIIADSVGTIEAALRREGLT